MKTETMCNDINHKMQVSLRGSHQLPWHSYALEPAKVTQEGQIQKIINQYFDPTDLNPDMLDLAYKYRRGMLCITTTERSHGHNVVGLHAFLPLSDFGVRQIEYNVFDGQNIASDSLATDFENAVALYWWISAVKPSAKSALPLVELELNRAPFYSKAIYAHAVTKVGKDALHRYGFEPVCEGKSKLGDYFSLKPVQREVV